jgi:hypothetical protein
MSSDPFEGYSGCGDGLVRVVDLLQELPIGVERGVGIWMRVCPSLSKTLDHALVITENFYLKILRKLLHC